MMNPGNADRWTKGTRRMNLIAPRCGFDLVFPPDLIELLERKRPIAGHDWNDERTIRRALDFRQLAVVR
jgi:hypothetical protein